MKNQFGVKSKYSKVEKVTRVYDQKDCQAQQQFKDRVTINSMIARYTKSGVWENVSEREQQYLDLSGVDLNNLGESLQLIVDMNQSFQNLPLSVRQAVNHDPATFLQIALSKDPLAIQQMQEWGLVEKSAEPAAATAGAAKPAEPAPEATKNGNLKKSAKVLDESPDEK